MARIAWVLAQACPLAQSSLRPGRVPGPESRFANPAGRKSRPTSGEPRATSHEPLAASHEPRATSRGPRAASHGLPARSHEPRIPGAGPRIPVSGRWPLPVACSPFPVPNSRRCFFATSYPQRRMRIRACKKPSQTIKFVSKSIKKATFSVKKGSKKRAFRHAHLNILGGHPLWR